MRIVNAYRLTRETSAFPEAMVACRSLAVGLVRGFDEAATTAVVPALSASLILFPFSTSTTTPGSAGFLGCGTTTASLELVEEFEELLDEEGRFSGLPWSAFADGEGAGEEGIGRLMFCGAEDMSVGYRLGITVFRLRF